MPASNCRSFSSNLYLLRSESLPTDAEPYERTAHKPQLETLAAKALSRVPGSISRLPDSILLRIFILSRPLRSVRSLSLVCSRWKRILDSEEYWKEFYRRSYVLTIADMVDTHGGKWRERCEEERRQDKEWRSVSFGSLALRKGHKRAVNCLSLSSSLAVTGSDDRKLKV
jgi:hypothetical protein